MKAHLLTMLALAGASNIATAQVQLTWSQGVLDGYWHHDLDWQPGSPGTLWFFLPSFNSGPTPLSTLDPTDPRELQIGLDLFPLLLEAGAVVGSGTSLDLGLPVIPPLIGQTLHAQFFTVPGTSTVVDEISNPVRMRVTSKGETWLAPGEMLKARRHHTLTPLPDGRVVVFGGEGPAGEALLQIETYDPQVQGFEAAGSSGTPRSRHGAVLLQNGKILITGGVNPSGTVLSSCRIYDPQTGTSVAAASMAVPRVLHTTLLLNDGRVLVAGGSTQFTAGDPLGYPAIFTGSLAAALEVYDPLTNTWKSIAGFPSGRTAMAATLQANGTALLTGGVAKSGPVSALTTARTFVFDPSDDSLSTGVDLPKPLALHLQILTEAGETLVVGGGTVKLSPANYVGSKSSFTIGTNDPAWTAQPDLNSLVACTDIVCVPRPADLRFRLPDVSSDLTGDLWDWVFGDVVYFAGGGASDISFLGGSSIVTPNSTYMRIFEDFGFWDEPATQIHVRPGSRFVATDEGRRLMIVGAPQGAPGDENSVELLTLP